MPSPPVPTAPTGRDPFRSGVRRAAAFLVAFAVLHVLAVWTPIGQRAENALVAGYADQARIFPLAQTWGPPPLTGEVPALVVGLTLIGAVAVARRRVREGCAAVAVVVGTLGVTEVLSKVLLVRPDLVDAEQNLREASFPSGHVAIAAALVLGLALVTAGRARAWATGVGTLWVALTSGAVQALYWHRPSDVLGAALLACAVFSVAHGVVGGGGPGGPGGPAAPDRRSRPRTRYLLPLTALVAVAAASREDAAARPLVFAAAAFCGALLVREAAVRAAPAPSVVRAVTSAPAPGAGDMPVPGTTSVAPGTGSAGAAAPGGTTVRPQPVPPAPASAGRGGPAPAADRSAASR
jgi:membrane-associated phospholipid phosphatase